MLEGTGTAAPVERARNEMQAALDRSHAQVAHALREWGVSPHDPEGRFVEALQIAQRATAEIVLSAATGMQLAAEGLDRHAAALTAKADAEVARMRQASAAAAAVHKKAEERTFEQLVAKLSDGVQKKLEAVLVVRQHRWERVLYWRASGLIALVGLTLVIGGYQWKAYVDADDARRATWCTEHVAVDPQGIVWCRWPPARPEPHGQTPASAGKADSIW